MTSLDLSGSKLASFTQPYRRQEMLCSAHNFMRGLIFVILFVLAASAPELAHFTAITA